MNRRKLWLVLLALSAPVVVVLLAFQALFSDLPDPEDLQARLNIPSLRVLDRHGRLLYEALPESGGRHSVVPLENIPLALRQATIATEDSRFYSHPGVDLPAVLRALWNNLTGREAFSGGSTLTQQVARNLLLGEEERYERSLRRKLREVWLAWQLTRRYSKDEILEFYLNQTYYGAMAYGVEAAAQTYFGKPVSELDLAESALLAGLPQAPALYNPFTDLEAARRRQTVVLERMEREGYLDAEQQELAARERLVLAGTPYPMEAPHFVMMVLAWLDEMQANETLGRRGDWTVRTSLDLDWQRNAERAVRRQLEALRRSDDGLGHNVNNGALVALDPYSGEIVALVGSPDYFDAANQGAINMALAPRQPGSALKPLVYAAALDPTAPHPWTAGTMILDVRTAFETHEGRPYLPENYDRKEHGPVLVRQALGSSLNIPAVATLNHTGLEKLFDLASDLGISTLGDPHDYDLSVALGGGAVRLVELAGAYGAFANGGFRVDPQFILEVRDAEGETLYRSEPPPRERVLDERVAWLISDILSDNDARRLGFGPNSALRLDRPAAVKTGTTTNFHDNWTVGYTPDLVVGVWTGNSDYRPMREIDGLTGAAPIWHEFMRSVLKSHPERPFERPDGLVQVEVCALSGMLPGTDCPYTRLEWFIPGTQPRQPDSLYRKVQVNTVSGRLAAAGTPPERQMSLTALDLPPEARPWARSQGLRVLADLLPEETPPGTENDSPSALALLSPPSGSVYVLAPGRSPDSQRVRVEATGEAGLRRVTLWVDDRPIGEFDRPPYAAWWRLETGQHRAWAEGIDGDGIPFRSQPVEFTVQGSPD